MSEKYPAAPRVFGTREWQTVERLSPFAPSRNIAIDLWLDDCEREVHVNTVAGEQWDKRRAA